MLAWHFSDGTLGYSDDRRVEAGVMYTCEGTPELCRNGMHASIDPIDAIAFRKGCIVSRVDVTGGVLKQEGKIVGANRLVLWTADATEVLRKFARLCATDVIDKWNAPEIIVRYLSTGDKKIRLEARSAAAAAAEAAAAYAADVACAADADVAYAAYAAYAADAADASCAADVAYAADAATAYAAAAAAHARGVRKRQNKRLLKMLEELRS